MVQIEKYLEMAFSNFVFNSTEINLMDGIRCVSNELPKVKSTTNPMPKTTFSSGTRKKTLKTLHWKRACIKESKTIWSTFQLNSEMRLLPIGKSFSVLDHTVYGWKLQSQQNVEMKTMLPPLLLLLCVCTAQTMLWPNWNLNIVLLCFHPLTAHAP